MHGGLKIIILFFLWLQQNVLAILPHKYKYKYKYEYFSKLNTTGKSTKQYSQYFLKLIHIYIFL